MIPFEFIILPILIVLSAFFSGAEVALVSISQAKVRTYLNEKRRGATSLSRLKSNSKRMIITILIGNNVANILAASMVAVFATNTFGSLGLGIATGIMTIIILIFGEIIPKTFASTHAPKIALLIARPIEILSFQLLPLVLILELLSNIANALLSIKKSETMTSGEIKSVLQLAMEKKIIDSYEKSTIERVLEFGNITAVKIMTPIDSVFSIDGNCKIQEVLPLIIESGYSRIPVYEGKKENITGFVIIKDILKVLSNNFGAKKINDLTKEIPSVPSLTHGDNLLRFLQNKQEHLAIVKEGDRIVGIITTEDLLEEIVGEITDTSDINPNRFATINKNTIIAHGDADVKKINNFFGIKTPSQLSKETLSQLIKRSIPYPKEGSSFRTNNILIRINEIDEKGKFSKVTITKKSTSDLILDSIKKILE
ncbi:hemolysin family protein [Patescibacteria group bacterium]|nr:hemolysin family protein [Patescibacteria group bacterium]